MALMMGTLSTSVVEALGPNTRKLWTILIGCALDSTNGPATFAGLKALSMWTTLPIVSDFCVNGAKFLFQVGTCQYRKLYILLICL